MGRLFNSVALIISLYFPPESSGGSNGAWNRAVVFHKMGYSVYVLCGFPAYPSGKISDPKYKGKLFYVETIESISVIRLRLLSLRHDGYLRRLVLFLNFIFLTILYLPKILKITGNIKLVYARAPIIFSSISGFIYSKITKSFFILEVPDLWPEELVAFRTKLSPLIMSLGKLVARIAYASPDIIVTVSELAADYISKEYKPKRPIFGIPVGVDSTRFPRISKEDAKAELVRDKVLPYSLENKFLVLYSGLISKAQRVENLVYAAHKLIDEKEIAILIIGGGPEKSNLLDMKHELGLDNLYILPSQPRNIMPKIISAVDLCTVLLAPEPIFEIALPSKFYEYLACGKPLIGVCRGELAKIINYNNIGRTVNFGDPNELAGAIKDLKNSPISIQTMVSNCYRTLQKYSLDEISFRYMDILKAATATVDIN